MTENNINQDYKKQYQEIAQVLLEQISSGKYPLGSKLPPERTIADAYGVSRTIVREALIALEVKGFISIKQSSGVYVINKPDSLQSRIMGPFELLQASQLLETNIAAFASQMITIANIETLKKILEQELQATTNNKSNKENDFHFHLTIAEATQNQMLVNAIKNLWKHKEKSFNWEQLAEHTNTKGYRLKWYADHQQILAALCRRDSEGTYKAMWQHIENEKNVLMNISDKTSIDFDGYIFSSVNLLEHLS
ncbi:transcriptional regulator [Gilliamella sp. wkB178]|uniref:GntR family transcriptional regulator n=1 Tax=Gilliamella sp. wkB178 TaxID=3120259 RepID=UPI00080ED2C1|nr:FCD domain-containing protein [Gilliamella apicola]OCG08061.1 transcriptional regulator [Gilliamella apicola]